MSKIKVLIVDDSAVVRKLLTNILSSDREIEVVGTAMDAFMAREKIKKLNPDVLTLDVEMPKMDGVTFLRNVMRLRPMPVVMVSTLTERGAEVTLDALDVGAVDFVTKPKLDITHNLEAYADEILTKVKNAAQAKVRPYTPPSKACPDAHTTDEVLGKFSKPKKHLVTTDKLIAIGASTGGTEAIREVLDALPPTSPAIVVTQHIPPKFSAAFAQRANATSALNVKEAEDGDLITPGCVYVAPGDRHLMVVKDGVRWKCRLNDGEPVNRHKPSVDVLFRSVAENVGPNALGVIMTGMGKDGANGLMEMRGMGSHTIAQDEASSVVWGMPGAAVDVGAAADVVALPRIAPTLIDYFKLR